MLVGLRGRRGQLPRLHVDGHTGEAAVAAAVVEMQVRVHDDRDAGAQLLGQRRRVREPGVDEDEPLRMLDRVYVDRVQPAVRLDVRGEVRADHGFVAVHAGNVAAMIGVGIALFIIGVIFLFIIPWVGIPVGIVGLVLLVLYLAGFGRRAARGEQPQQPR